VATLAYKVRYWLALVGSVIFWINFGLPVFVGDLFLIAESAFLSSSGSFLFDKFSASIIIITAVFCCVFLIIFMLFQLFAKKDTVLQKVGKIHMIVQGIFLSLFVLFYIIFSLFTFVFLPHIVAWLSTSIPFLLISLGTVKHNINNDVTNAKKQRRRGIIFNIVILIISCITIALLIPSVFIPFDIPIAIFPGIGGYIIASFLIIVILTVILNLVFNTSSPQKYLNSYKNKDLFKKDYFAKGFFGFRRVFRNVRQSIKNTLMPLLFGFGLIFTLLLIAFFQDDPEWVVGGMLQKLVIAMIFIIMGVIAFFEITIYLPMKLKIKKAFANYKNTRAKFASIMLSTLIGVLITLAGCYFMFIISTSRPWNPIYAFPGLHTRRFFRFLIYSSFSILGIFAGGMILLGGFIGGRMTKDVVSGLLSGFWTAIFCNVWFFLRLPNSGLEEKILFIPAVAITFLVYSTCLGLLGGYNGSFKFWKSRQVEIKNMKDNDEKIGEI